MATALFDKIIFGPVNSRRLGRSLGVNLLDQSAKICNFDCVYCECGWNKDARGGHFNDPQEVISILRETLTKMSAEGDKANYITFAGNGEPTLHPEFRGIMRRVVALRDELMPSARIGVLTNATRIDREDVREALGMIDRNILKFDSAIYSSYLRLNKPSTARTIEDQITLLKNFSGTGVIQTMMVRGEIGGNPFDNTTPQELTAWLDALREIAPAEVMLYSIDRDTPLQTLKKIEKDELEQIAQKVRELGIPTQVS